MGNGNSMTMALTTMDSCHRLNKACPSQTPAPPRKRKEPKPGRIGELERRIMDLTARVESVSRQAPSPPESEGAAVPLPHTRRASHGQGGPSPLSAANSSTRERWSNPFGHIFLDNDSEQHSPQAPVPGELSPVTSPFANTGGPRSSVPAEPPTAVAIHPGPPLPPPPQHRKQSRSLDMVWPEGDEAETLLVTYKSNLAHLFPFAVVPPHMSSYELRQKKPFFWKAVMMEAYLNDGAQQMALGHELLRDISEAAITRPQKGLDLLQGLQVLISWSVPPPSPSPPCPYLGIECALHTDAVPKVPLQPQQLPDDELALSREIHVCRPRLQRTPGDQGE